METLKFKTNIKCGGCMATVMPFLDADKSINKWQVDLESADRILTVITEKSAGEVVDLVKMAGYSAKEID